MFKNRAFLLIFRLFGKVVGPPDFPTGEGADLTITEGAYPPLGPPPPMVECRIFLVPNRAEKYSFLTVISWSEISQ